MGIAHTYYEPTEYEQMLIAANWLSIQDVDTDYQEHVTTMRRRREDELSYSQWLSSKREWDELNATWEAKVQPYCAPYVTLSMPREIEELQDSLLRRMNWLEILLGY